LSHLKTLPAPRRWRLFHCGAAVLSALYAAIPRGEDDSENRKAETTRIVHEPPRKPFISVMIDTIKWCNDLKILTNIDFWGSKVGSICIGGGRADVTRPEGLFA